MLRSHRLFVQNAFDELQKRKIIKSVEKLNHYYDEPKIHYFSAHKYSSKYESSAGLSFDNPSLAQLKCAGEAIERNVLLDTSEQKFKRAIYTKFKKNNALNPNLLNENVNNLLDIPLLWIEAYEGINKSRKVWVPAQTIFMNRQIHSDEPLLLPMITTGAAGGFDHESTLLRAIYEVIERDSFMSVYLTKSVPKKINLTSIPYKKIQNIIAYLRRYQLEPHVFDITTEIGIPSYMVIVVDKTGIGPSFTIGAKSGYNTPEVLLGACEEALLTRPWSRKIKRQFYGKKILQPLVIKTNPDRAQFWFQKKMQKQISFFWNGVDTKFNGSKHTFSNKAKELEFTYEKLQKSGYKLYFGEIQNRLSRKVNYKVYKAIIPQLQPLYINEAEKIIQTKRLSKASQFFGNKTLIINTVPHPFL